MIEVLLLISLGRNIAARARAKEWSGGAGVALLVVLWFGGEVAGAVAGVVASLAAAPAEEPNVLLVYGGCLAGAVAGAVAAFTIVRLLPDPAEEYEEFEEYDEDDR